MGSALLIVGLAVALASGAPKAALLAAGAQGQELDRLEQLTQAFATLDARDLDGQRWTAAGARGRIVVVDFWATWCAPCLAEIPWLRQVRDRFGANRVEVLGVNLDLGDRRGLIAWLNRQQIDWPQIWDGRGYNGRIARQFGVTSLPTSLLVDADGRVVAVNLREERLLSAVDELLAQ